MQVHIETIAPIRVAYVRHQGPYAECSVAWDKLCGWLGMEGYLSPGRRFIGISYDDPDETPPEKIRYDACVEIEDDFEATSEIGVQTIAGGDYARVTHQGPYETLSESYRRVLGQWLPRQSRRLRNAPGFEVYFNTPESTAPEDLVTDIYIPLA
jgi:AraC family transcriptional regulator